MRKNFKKLTAITLTAAMTMGSAMTVFAAPSSGDVAGGGVDSNGSYEGGEIPYPAITVTLPTIPANTIDYIADPNDLIKSTLNDSGDAINSAYANSEFKSSTGIYFKTSDASGDVKAQYTEKSKPMTITNENAQNINLTVKVAQTQAATGGVAYSDDATFDAADTDKKLYLAVTDGQTTEALDASGDASFTTEIKGRADNFVPKHSGGKYSYEKKADASGWASASYQLTGAVNKNAEWDDSVTFPNVKLTWSWVEGAVEKDVAPSVVGGPYTYTSGQPTAINLNLGSGSKKATTVKSVKNKTLNIDLAMPTYGTYNAGVLTVLSGATTYWAGKSQTSMVLEITFDNGEVATVTLNKA